MESKQNKDLDNFIKKKIDEIPVEYKEAHWDKAFLVLEGALPLLPKTNWFWWLGGIDMLILAGSASWFSMGTDSGHIVAKNAVKDHLKSLPANEIILPNGPEKANTIYSESQPATKHEVTPHANYLAFAGNNDEDKEYSSDFETAGSNIFNSASAENQASSTKFSELQYSSPDNFNKIDASKSNRNITVVLNDSGEKSELVSENFSADDNAQMLSSQESTTSSTTVTSAAVLETKQGEVHQEVNHSEESPAPPPDLAHADLSTNSFFSLLFSGGLSSSFTEGWKSPGNNMSLSLQFNRNLRENVGLVGGFGLNYRNGIDESTAIDQLSYGFGSSFSRTSVKWMDMLSADLSAGFELSPSNKHHFVLNASARFLIDTRAEITNSVSESISQKWGYRDGFSKADLVISGRYEFSICDNWRLYLQYSQGLGDRMSDDYFGRAGAQRDASWMFGAHYLLKSRKQSAEGQYVKP